MLHPSFTEKKKTHVRRFGISLRFIQTSEYIVKVTILIHKGKPVPANTIKQIKSNEKNKFIAK